jgi:O-antigen ligase
MITQRTGTLTQQVAISSVSGFGTLAILGCVAAAIAGLTRPETIDFARPDTFAYEAEPMVWVFAAVTLLPCLAYAHNAGKSIRFGFLLWFLLGTVTFTKDFSYIRVPGQPIFVTDIVLAVLILSLTIFNPKLRPNIHSTPGKFLMAYLAVGVFTFCRSVFAGRPLLLSLRDAAIVWYALFFLAGYLCASDPAKLLLLGKVFFLGAALTSIVAIFYFIHYPQYGYGVHLTPGGIYVAAALGILLVGLESGFVRKDWRAYGLAALFAIGLLLSDARTNYLALCLMLVGAILLLPKARRKQRVKALKPILRGGAVLTLIVIALMATPLANKFVTTGLRIAYQGLVTPKEDPDALWRLAAWATALNVFQAHPLVGIGYGSSFHFDFQSNDRSGKVTVDARPHNTFLTVLYQMGLIGMAPVLALLSFFFFRALKYLRGITSNDTPCLLVVLLQVAFVILGMFNLALETPFYGSLFWLNLGIGFWLIQGKTAWQMSTTQAIAKLW